MSQSKALRKKRFGFLPPKLPLHPDPFWAFIRSNAQELDDYPYSGHLLLDVELIAPDTLASTDQIGKDLTRIVKSTFISFRPEDSAQSTAILESADFSESSIRSFLLQEGREHELADFIGPIKVTVEHLKSWLGAVTHGYVGILAIG